MLAETESLATPFPPDSGWTRRQLCAMLAVVLLFAAGLLQFAQLQWQHAPAEERVNNGSQPTFFAVYLRPAYIFSEDFYLYYVRAKRIAERGWSDSLFHHRDEEGKNYSAPVQVALSTVGIATDGHPVWYSLFMFTVLGASWSVLLVVARCCLPRGVANRSVLLAVLVTVLLEAVPGLTKSIGEHSGNVWPALRALRMSTLAWTNPLMVAAMLCATSLLIDRRRYYGRLATLVTLMLLLAGADNWAFALTLACTGAVLAGLAMYWAWAWLRSSSLPQHALQVCCALGGTAAMTFWLHAKTTTALAGDALLRGGMGNDWRQCDRAIKDASLGNWLVAEALLPLGLVIALSCTRLVPGKRFPCRLVWRVPEAWGLQGMAFALQAVVGVIAVCGYLVWRGIDPYHLLQFFWRANYSLLFVLAIAACQWCRAAVIDCSVLSFGIPRLWPRIVATGFCAFFAFHVYAVHRFVTTTAAHEFFLTADAERLRPWLENFGNERGSFRLATASLELNYLCAFWTNADLMLPSGFPYHNAETNDEIHNRLLELLALYRTSSSTWLTFTEISPGKRFQELWRTNRVAASGQGYLYHLFHRMLMFRTPATGQFRQTERNVVAEQLKSGPRIAQSALPDVILIDETSRALGEPDLQFYRREFKSGSLEAWVLQTPLVANAMPNAAGRR